MTSYRMCVGLLIGLLPAVAVAADLPKEGNYEYTACWSGTSNTIAFSKTHSATSFEQMGTILSTVPGGLFDKETFRCVGANAAFAGKYTSTATCEGIDPDGNKRLTYFSSSDGKITREFVVGTGKYEGMVTSGTVQPLGPFRTIKEGTFQNCNHQKGTYKLK